MHSVLTRSLWLQSSLSRDTNRFINTDSNIQYVP